MAKPGSQAARSLARGAYDRPSPRKRTGVIDTSAFDPFLARFDQATSEMEVMQLMIDDYPQALHAFRRRNWRALAMTPAPAPGKSLADAIEAGWYSMRLRDGTDGYFMRRSDDCSTATVATLVGCHPSLVPDPREMQRILSGVDPQQVMAELDDEYDGVFAARTGVRLTLHSTPPVWSRRWIAVIEKDENPLSNHLMVMSGRDLLFDPAHQKPPEDDRQTALEGWGVQDISFGYTLDD